MKRADYELIAKVIKKVKLDLANKRNLCICFVEELRKNGNFDQDKFTVDCGVIEIEYGK